MMPKLIISISNQELDALVKLAMFEMRNPRDQLRFILHRTLLEHKLLECDQKQIIPLGERNGQSGSAMIISQPQRED
jgi:hypothetical protein